MKAIISCLSILVLNLSQGLYAQTTAMPYADLPACLTNGQFTGACVTGTSCDAWDDNCTAGWRRSHGSPTMASYTDNGQDKFYIYMWSQGTNLGEGVFTSYLFRSYYTYTVKLRISSSGGTGNLRIFAANGLAEPATAGCGQAIPTITEKVEIGSFAGNTTGQDIEFSFTNNSSVAYTQLWIYPEGTGNGQYNVNIFSVEACRGCNTSVIYNNLPVPPGTTKSGYIYAGTSAGTGGGTQPVQIYSDQHTEFLAANEIDLLPEFDATVTTGVFTADIYYCNSGVTRRSTVIGNLPVAPPTNDMETMKAMNAVAVNRNLNVYPTVSTGQINISGDLLSLENVELTVFDLTGRRVVQFPKKSYARKATIDLGSLNNGSYLLQIKQKDNIIARKIIIQK